MLLAILAIGALADLMTTAIGLRDSGYSEVNGRARWLFERFGFWPASIAIKILGFALAVAAQSFFLTGWVFVAVLAVGQWAVVAWNLKELAK